MALPTSKIALSSYPQQANKAYIAVLAFNGKVFSYSTYVDSSFQTRGTLAANAVFTADNAKAGRVLHANGKFLNVGTHPDVSKYYIGVYDPVTGGNGFIDPTDTAFAPYDANLPSTYNLGTSGVAAPPLGGAGQLLEAGVDSGNLTQATQNAGVNAGAATIGQITFNVASTSCVVTSTSVKPNSRVFLTMVGPSTPVAYCVDDIGNNVFTIRVASAGAYVFHFMIVNTNVQ